MRFGDRKEGERATAASLPAFWPRYLRSSRPERWGAFRCRRSSGRGASCAAGRVGARGPPPVLTSTSRAAPRPSPSPSSCCLTRRSIAPDRSDYPLFYVQVGRSRPTRANEFAARDAFSSFAHAPRDGAGRASSIATLQQVDGRSDKGYRFWPSGEHRECGSSTEREDCDLGRARP